ncbi:prostate stem cell antigen [Athene cunicularia]|uniref:Prostate stem cell antigen n=1 Tax=Athene cunicularia TaxID=194338 RepID=A0A663LQP3_ATHCN|nr:prostate stem cell antigen [Athene cunicularia]
MKTFLVLLLGAVLCLGSGSSLQCYSCTAQLSNSNCQKKVDCKDKEICKTEVFRASSFFSLINKGCDSSCEPLYQQLGVGSRNVSCCNSNLCNFNAASSVRCSYGMAAGITAGVLWTFLNNRL